MVPLITRILYMPHGGARCWMTQAIRYPLYSAAEYLAETDEELSVKLNLVTFCCI